MSVYAAWTSVPVDPTTPGPWSEIRLATDSLCFVDSTDTLSRVYHELKWSLPDGTALLVAPLAGTPKLKGMRPGTQSWLRARLTPSG